MDMTDETTISHRRNLVTIRNLKKIYHTEDGEKVALHDVNLNITKRDIYGIIGLSGAGKSTLVRCINGLERYDGGSMVVDGHEITDLSKKDLRAVRRSIGMIFQSFNLMPSRTVAGNVELALLDSGLGKGERESRVKELLELVDLSEKVIRTNYLVVRSNALPSHGHWPTILASCSVMRPPVHLIPTLRSPF